jgi:hypothetical protein
MNQLFEITFDMVDWIIDRRIHRNFDQELQNRLTLNQLRNEFCDAFPNSKDSLDFGTARHLDEQLCGNGNCGQYWRQAYGFPGEVGTIMFNEQRNQYIRVTSTGIFTFNFEVVDPQDHN